MADDIVRIGLAVDSRDVKKANAELGKLGKQGKETNRATDGLTKSFGGLGNAAKMMAGAMAAVGAVRFLSGAIEEAIQYEKNMNVIEHLVKQTGAAAWVSAGQLEEQARAIGFATLQSVEGVMAAQQTMLTFRGVMGDVFDRSIIAAADMSAALGQDLKSSTLQLGKALEDPVKGLTALSRSGTVFTDQQKAMVEAMVDAGNVADAQRFILSELEAQYGGAGRAAATGLAGSLDTLSQKWQEFKIGIVEDSTGDISTIIDSIGNSFDFILKVVKSVAVAFTDLGGAIAAYTAIAAEIATLNFDNAKAIKAERDQQAAAAEKRLEDIWAEKNAVEDLSMTVRRTAEQEAAIEAKRQEQAAARKEQMIIAQQEREKELAAQRAKKEEERILAQWAKDEEYRAGQWERDLEWFDEELARDQENYDRKLAAANDYYERLYNLETGSVQASYDFATAIRDMDYKSALQNGALMLSNVAKNSKAMFGVQKALALAQAAVSLPSAVLESFRNGGGYPTGLIPAGLMLKAGLDQISAINSASFGGGVAAGGGIGGGGSTSPSAPSGSLPPGSTALPGGEELKAAPPARELRVSVESDGPHSDGMRQFIDNFAETLRDMGSNINVVVA